MKKPLLLLLSIVLALSASLFAVSCTVTSGKKSVSDDSSSVSEEVKEYSISYVLNGGMNDEDNPTSYTGEETVALKDASYKRCEFMGWYDNEQFTGEPIVEIPQGSSGDIVLYAKYDGPRVFFHTGDTEPITLYGRDISLTYTKGMADEYAETVQSILNDISAGEMPLEELEAKIDEYVQAKYFITKEDRIANIIADTTALAEDYEIEREIYDLLLSFQPNIEKFDIAFASSVYRNDYYCDLSEEEIDEYIASLAESSSTELAELDSKMNSVLKLYYSGELDPFDAVVQYVGFSNEYAALCGYDNYLEYSYGEVYDRDYSVEDTDSLADYIQRYIVPLRSEAEKRCELFYREFSEEETEEYDLLANGFYAHSLDYFDDYAELIGDDYLKNYKHYFDSGNYFYSANENDNVTGYIWYFGDGTPFMFLSGDCQNVSTFIHEFGHYNAALTGGDNASLDLSETQSQGNELLFYKYLVDNDCVSEKVGKCYFANQVGSMSENIIDGFLVNEMEKFVYTTDLTQMTKNEFYQKWTELCEENDLDDYAQYTEWLMSVLLNYQCYYISYATSALASLELLASSYDDYDRAIESYKAIYKRYPRTSKYTFTAILEEAGLYGVFTEDAFLLLDKIKFEEE